MSKPVRFPSYRLHKASGQAVVTIGGRMFYLGKFGSIASREEYNRIMAEWEARGFAAPPDTAKSRAASDQTVTELIAAYWRYARDYYRKEGRETGEVVMIRRALQPVKDLYGHTLAKDFGPLALKAVQNTMIAMGWSRKHINGQVGRVRRFFEWAVSNELLPVSVHQALKTVPGLRKGRTEARETDPVRPVKEDVVELTLAKLSPTVSAMVRVQQFTGMRPAEVVSMRIENIDRSDPDCWVYRPEHHKTEHHERERIVFIGPRAQAALAPPVGGRAEGPVFSPEQAEAERNAARRTARKSKLWPSHETHQAQKRESRPGRTFGETYTVASYRRAIHRACDLAFPHPELSKRGRGDLTDEEKATLKAWRRSHRWSPHRLRHSAATLIRKRFGVEVAQAVLGHAELEVTQIYAEKDLEAARKAMKELG